MNLLYKVGESNVIIRNRPKKLIHGEDDFDEEDRADAYLSVTDTWLAPPHDRIFVWCPWNEDRYPTPDMLYATVRTLMWWIHYQKIKNIQVFCDGGTHRSVTVFGAFLTSYCSRQEREKIVSERVSLNDEENNMDWANPLQYIAGYLELFPADRLLLKSMGEDHMSRLDVHMSNIYEMVKERYGKKN